jgi:hypothetical protein
MLLHASLDDLLNGAGCDQINKALQHNVFGARRWLAGETPKSQYAPVTCCCHVRCFVGGCSREIGNQWTEIVPSWALTHDHPGAGNF